MACFSPAIATGMAVIVLAAWGIGVFYGSWLSEMRHQDG